MWMSRALVGSFFPGRTWATGNGTSRAIIPLKPHGRPGQAPYGLNGPPSRSELSKLGVRRRSGRRNLLNALERTRASKIGLVAVVAALSIHLHPCQGGPPPLKFVIPTEANPDFLLRGPHQRPRVRLSVKESRMKLANATDLHRKSGVAERRDLQFAFGHKRMCVGELPPGSVFPSTQTAGPSASVGMTNLRGEGSPWHGWRRMDRAEKS